MSTYKVVWREFVRGHSDDAGEYDQTFATEEAANEFVKKERDSFRAYAQNQGWRGVERDFHIVKM